VSLDFDSVRLPGAAAVQRKEPLTSAGFLAAQFHELWSRPAAVRVGRRSTQTGRLSERTQRPKAVIGRVTTCLMCIAKFRALRPSHGHGFTFQTSKLLAIARDVDRPANATAALKCLQIFRECLTPLAFNALKHPLTCLFRGLIGDGFVNRFGNELTVLC
jgi:hypothetical protein